MVIKQKLVEGSTSEQDPYSLFLYAMNSPVTRDRYTTRLKRFFVFIGIEGTSIEERCRVFVEKGRKWADDRCPTIEEIRMIVDYPDRRIKPIVYTMVSSGIRLGAWDYLRWGHICPIHNNDHDLLAAKILVCGGEEEQYTTYISPEAYNALFDWMDFRIVLFNYYSRQIFGFVQLEDAWMS